MEDKSITTHFGNLLDACGDKKTAREVERLSEAVSAVLPTAHAGPHTLEDLRHATPGSGRANRDANTAKPSLCRSHRSPLFNLPNELLLEITRQLAEPTSREEYALARQSVDNFAMTSPHISALVSETILAQCNRAPQRMTDVDPAFRLQEFTKLFACASKFHSRQPHLAVKVIHCIPLLNEGDQFEAAKRVLETLAGREHEHCADQYHELALIIRQAIDRLPNATERDEDGTLMPSTYFVLHRLFNTSLKSAAASHDAREDASTCKVILDKLTEEEIYNLFKMQSFGAEQGQHALAARIDELLSFVGQHRVDSAIVPLVGAIDKLPRTDRASRYQILQALTDEMISSGTLSNSRLPDTLHALAYGSHWLPPEDGQCLQAIQWLMDHVDAIGPDSPNYSDALYLVLVELAGSIDWYSEKEQHAVFQLIQQRTGQLNGALQQEIYQELAYQVNDDELDSELAAKVEQWHEKNKVKWPAQREIEGPPSSFDIALNSALRAATGG